MLKCEVSESRKEKLTSSETKSLMNKKVKEKLRWTGPDQVFRIWYFFVRCHPIAKDLVEGRIMTARLLPQFLIQPNV